MPIFTPAFTARRVDSRLRCDVVLQRRHRLRREPVLVLRVDVVAVVIDRRHPHRAALHHLRDRLVVHIDAVLDRIRAGAHRVAARRTARTSGSRPCCPARARCRRSPSSRRRSAVCVRVDASKLPREPKTLIQSAPALTRSSTACASPRDPARRPGGAERPWTRRRRSADRPSRRTSSARASRSPCRCRHRDRESSSRRSRACGAHSPARERP